jgi:hypothetical protein
MRLKIELPPSLILEIGDVLEHNRILFSARVDIVILLRSLRIYKQ